MNEIIKIEQKDGIETVNARDLHEFMEVQSKFADWIKNRIEKYSFIENVDYVTVSKNLESGGLIKEYHISVDMAKQLSMVENNEKGMIARQYFIDCEKTLKKSEIQLAIAMQKVEDRLVNLEQSVNRITYKPRNKKKGAVIKSRYILHGYNFARVEFNGSTYIIGPNFYDKNKVNVCYDNNDEKEFPQSIKTGLLTENNALKWIEKNL